MLQSIFKELFPMEQLFFDNYISSCKKEDYFAVYFICFLYPSSQRIQSISKACFALIFSVL